MENREWRSVTKYNADVKRLNKIAGDLEEEQTEEKYTAFYPETGRRIAPPGKSEFDTPEAAVEHWLAKHRECNHNGEWKEIKPTNPIDQAALIWPGNGTIIVIRQIEEN
ncbi:MAG: hypothetical protein KAR42_17950 [candidate division Zixibacteria bacterium]|nr:hypothetical protein [candidate division Zixibacteria bacterium]